MHLLSAFLSHGNLRAEKGKCELYKADVYGHAKDIKFIADTTRNLMPTLRSKNNFNSQLEEYQRALGNNLYLGAIRSYKASDGKILFRLAELSEHLNIPLVATNDVHYHIPAAQGTAGCNYLHQGKMHHL